MPVTLALQPGDALVIVDMQNDFLRGGALAVPRAEEILPALNDYAARFERAQLPIFATRDWHPENHSSFHREHGPWPPHCVRHTRGADLAAGLLLPPSTIMISKGTSVADDRRSAFANPDFEQALRLGHVRRLLVGGVATDGAVLHTVRDARARGFEVYLLRDAVRAMNFEPGDGQKAEEDMCRLGTVMIAADALCRSNPGASALLTDVCELTMLHAYYKASMNETAVFEFVVRSLPPRRNFLVAAGLEQVLDFLEDLRLTTAELEWMEATRRFTPEFLENLRGFHFTGDVYALPEGTLFFAHEPVLRVVAPIAQAQLVEARLVNLVQFKTLVASKAARAVLVAADKRLVDFGLRRAHGAEAAMLAARACYLAGFAATSDVLAGQQFGIPVSGTMAHSFIEAAESESDAFRVFARANPGHVVLLLDTFDTVAAARKVVDLAVELRAGGVEIKGVHISRGDLEEESWRVRRILDAGALHDVTIFVSGNLDETAVERLVSSGAPIDGFGVGTHVISSSDAPLLDYIYQLQSYAGKPRCDCSGGRAAWPGVKQIYRQFDATGQMECDVVTLDDEKHAGEPLLRCVMRGGSRTGRPEPLVSVQQRVGHQLRQLPPRLRSLAVEAPYPIYMSELLHTRCGETGIFSGADRSLARCDRPSITVRGEPAAC